GGRGTTWQAGSIVLKPADRLVADLEWEAESLGAVAVPGVRIVTPSRSRDGALIVEGWTAAPFVDGVFVAGRWAEVLHVGRRLNEALGGQPRPAFLTARRSLWDAADLAAWGEIPDAFLAYPHVAALAALRRPFAVVGQRVHGDLTGNALFAPNGDAAVIDFTPYWRPAGYALAIVVADAIVWEAAPTSLLDDADLGVDGDQLFIRALLSR